MSDISATYVSEYAFTVAGNRESEFLSGRRVRANCGEDGYKHSSVDYSTYDSGTNETTIVLKEPDLTSNLTGVKYGVIAPGDYGALPDHDHSGPGEGGDLQLELIRKPVVNSPNESAQTSPSLIIEGSSYQSLYSGETRAYRIFEVDVSGGDFSSPVRNHEADVDNWEVDPMLDPDSSYKVRIKDVSSQQNESDWSDVVAFDTMAVFIESPDLISPTNNATNTTLEPTLEVEQNFNVIGAEDTHQSTDWQVASDSGFNTIVWQSIEDGTNLYSIDVPEGELDQDTGYFVRARFRGAEYGTSSWSNVHSFGTDRVMTPSVLEPSDGDMGVSTTKTIEASPFSLRGDLNPEDHTMSDWEIATDSGFSNIVFSSYADAVNLVSIEASLDADTEHFVRVRYHDGHFGWSEWSDSNHSFTTANEYIEQPTITSPTDNETDTDHHFTITASVYNAVNITPDHDKTDWEVSTSSDFGETVFSSYDDAINLESIDLGSVINVLLDAGITYYVRCRYYGLGFGWSAWSDSNHSFTTADVTVDTPTLTVEGAPNDVSPNNPQMETTVFSTTGGAATHHSTDWEIRNSGDTETIWSSLENEVSLLEITSSGLEELTEYIFRARHRSAEYGASDWQSVTATTSEFIGYLFTSSIDSSVHKIDPSDMSQIATYTALNEQSRALVWGGDGYLYAGEGDWQSTSASIVHKIDPDDMSQVGTFDTDSAVYSLAWGGDGYLYAGTHDRTIYKIDPSDMSQIATYSGDNSIMSLAWGGDGYLYAGLNERQYYPERLLQLNPDNLTLNNETTTPWDDILYGLDWGGDGYLYVGSYDEDAYQLDPANLDTNALYTGHTDNVRDVVWGGDGYVYSASADTTVHKIDPSNMAQVATYTGSSHDLWSVLFGIDGYLYSGDAGGNVYKIDPSDMTLEGTYTGHTDRVMGLAWNATPWAIHGWTMDGNGVVTDYGTDPGDNPGY